MSLYDKQKRDFTIVKGDDFNIPFQFFYRDKTIIDIRNWKCDFTITHPMTGEELVTKYHESNGAVTSAYGIAYIDDTDIPTELTGIITANNQIIIILGITDTALDIGNYPYDVQFTKNDSGNTVFTPISGFIRIVPERTQD